MKETVPDGLLRGLANYIRSIVGVPVEYVSVTWKLMDKPAEAKTYRLGLHDRQRGGSPPQVLEE